MALGARRGAVVRLVLAPTAAMVGVGLVAGVILSALLAPVFSSWGGGSLFTSSNLIGVALIFMVVAVIACGVPAYRATKVDPMIALRYE
jgi:putative ABC transport system permease protein